MRGQSVSEDLSESAECRVARRDWTYAEDREGQEAGCIVGEAGCESLWRVRDGQALFEDDVGCEAVDDFRELMPVQRGDPRGRGAGHSRVGGRKVGCSTTSPDCLDTARACAGVDEPTLGRTSNRIRAAPPPTSLSLSLSPTDT